MIKGKFIKLFFVLFNLFIWIITKLIPNKLLLKLVKSRPWKIISYNFSKKRTSKLKKTIKFHLRFLSQRKNNIFSSCLSISISGMIILDFFKISNVFNVGIYKNKERKKIPHVWLSDPTNNTLFTTGLETENSVFLNSL